MKQKGFTFIEVIVCLVLLGLIGVFVGQSFLRVVQSYVFAKTNTQLTEKVQLALTRMSLELQYADSIKSAAGKRLTYTTTKDDTGGSNPPVHTLEITPQGLELDAHLLLGDLAGKTSFSYRNFEDKVWTPSQGLQTLAYVDIVLAPKHPVVESLEFKTSIDIRNNGVENAVVPASGNP